MAGRENSNGPSWSMTEMPSTSFSAVVSDGWDMFLQFKAQWEEWVEDPGSARKALLTAILGNHVLDWTCGHAGFYILSMASRKPNG
jgi:hypothetical protein